MTHSADHLEYVKCNLCGADDTEVFMEVDGFKIVTCRECGLKYVNPRLDRTRLKALYSKSYYKDPGQGSYNEKFFSDYMGEGEVRTKEFERRIRDFLPLLKGSRGQLLDVGCAAGFFLDVARRHGFQAEGVEISPHACRYAREKLHLNVFNGSLEQAGFPEDAFDVVTSWDCVEHVPDPSAFLEEIRRILKPGGMAVLETLNMDSVGAFLYKKNFKPIVPEAHIYYFSTSSFLRMLNKAGFQTTRIDFPYFNSRWFDLAEISRMLEDLKLLRQGKQIERKSPAFWGNLVVFCALKV